MVAHALILTIRETDVGGSCEFKATLVYKVTWAPVKSRTVRAITENPVSKTNKVNQRK